MSHPPAPAEASPPNEPAGSLRQRLGGQASRLVHWAIATRLRMAVTGTVGLVAMGGMFASWSYMAHLAVDAPDPVSVDSALTAMDEGRFADAKAMIAEMHELPAEPASLGGAMFVMGAVKIHEADTEPSVERRRAVYQVAARYLLKARALGLDSARHGQAAYLVGKSLVRGGQPRAGIPALEEALLDPEQPQSEIHLLLAHALLEAPNPNLELALAHNAKVLDDKSLPAEELAQAWLDRAEMLTRLKRTAEAKEAIDHLAVDGPWGAARSLMLGRLALDDAEPLAAETSERDAKIHAALGLFREARQQDEEGGAVTRQAMFWAARCHELRGETEEAFAEYGRLSKLYGDTPEGIVAALAEADHQRVAGQLDRALAQYRQVMLAVGDPQTYHNPLMSLEQLRRRIEASYQQLVDAGHFPEALEVVKLAEPVFGRAGCIELQAKIEQQCGIKILEQSGAQDRWASSATQREARAHLREAGFAFEKLARMRPGSRTFTDDLWIAADCFFQGHSYTKAAGLLEEYLHHEARRRNADALLRLGQSRLAGNRYDPAISAFQECIELFPKEAVAYQARLECARAYQQTGKFDAAESLLTINLSSEALTPKSLEWRDSKFALGRLLYESERYDESIATLREAVERYPDAEATLLAKYTMARAYHNAAASPSQRVKAAKTDDERQKNREASEGYLDLALAAYVEVQRAITDRGHAEANPLENALLRHCYMMQGSVLFELRRYAEARQAYGSVITLYQNDPIVLECYVQAANCWRRMAQPVKARVMLDQARMVLERLPKETDFLASTNFNREQWESLLSQMGKW